MYRRSTRGVPEVSLADYRGGLPAEAVVIVIVGFLPIRALSVRFKVIIAPIINRIKYGRIEQNHRAFRAYIFFLFHSCSF